MSLFQPASRLAGIGVSPILAQSARAAEMRAAGADVIDLTVGEPDFETPGNVRDAAVRAVHGGRTRYTPLPGANDLRLAVAERMRVRHGLEVGPARVIACSGAKQVIHNALAASLDLGQEVILPQPFWTSYADMVALEGGRPTTAPGRWDPVRGWRLDVEAIEAAVTPATRWLLLNSPGNPAGSVMDAGERRAVADLLGRHPQVLLLCDDIYEDIVFGPAQRTLAADHPELLERTLIVGGVSKAYAMTGWRLGWGVGPEPLVRAMAAVQSQTTSAPSSISQAAAVEALNGPQDAVADMVAAFRERRDAIAPRLDRIPGLACPSPEGAFYLFPRVQDLLGRATPEGRRIETDVELAAYLLEEAKVAVAAGTVFAAPGHLRLSFAAALDRLEEACGRIEHALDRLT